MPKIFLAFFERQKLHLSFLAEYGLQVVKTALMKSVRYAATMAFTLLIDHDCRIVEVRYRETVTDQELLEVEKQLRHTPEFTAGYRLLHNCLSVTNFCVTGKGLYALSVKTQDLTRPTAIIASTGLIQGMAITYEAMANWNVPRLHVFAAEAEAREWLSRAQITHIE